MTELLASLNTVSLWGAVAVVIQAGLTLGVVLRVILTRHPPASSLAWIVLTLALPYVGFILYLLIGEKPIGRWREFRMRQALYRWEVVLSQKPAAYVGELPAGQRHKGLVRLAQKLGDIPMSRGSTIELIGDTDAALKRIISDIDAAKTSVSMEFYIWSAGGLADAVAESLIAAAGRGVACKVLLDDIGSHSFFKSAWPERLQAAGVHVLSALPVRFFAPTQGRLDLRLHRKTIVIDNRVGYTGSLNMVDPAFFNQNEHVGEWIDAMARITGAAVADLNLVFSFDWALQPDDAGQQFSFLPVPAVPPEGDARIVVVPSGPTAPDDANMRVIIEAINCARRSVLISTPYFVPNEAMAVALQNAAWRGVDVRLLLPAKNDSQFVQWASHRYFEGLMAADVKILRFDAGLLHTKAITVDDDFALFGTVNLDNRSLHLNFEMMLLVFDPKFVADLVRLLRSYEARCSEVDPVTWHKRPLKDRLLEGICYLLSPLL